MGKEAAIRKIFCHFKDFFQRIATSFPSLTHQSPVILGVSEGSPHMFLSSSFVI